MLQESLIQAPSAPAQGADAPWSRIDFSPPDGWTEAETYDTATRAKAGRHLTHLCWARQVDAASGRSFHFQATCLETSQAVQQESQWSLELDARTQRLTIHWVRLVRGGERIDQLKPGRLRLRQAETQPERLVLDGRWTLLLMLDDARPGDVLETAYTYETRNPVRLGGCELFFSVPPQVVVGHYRLSVRLAAGLEPRWKASADAPPCRVELLADGCRRWSWEGTQTAPREAESHAADNAMDHVWVQVSDLAVWSSWATKVAQAWTAVGDAAGWLAPGSFARPARVDAEEIMRLVGALQDDFRHQRMDLAAGGGVPAVPSAVVRRNYAEASELVWLAVTVLRAWGVKARPILVSAAFREKLAGLLPMAGLLDHAVLEVEWEGVIRWFDLAENSQGGGFAERALTWFGFGLPVDHTDNGLRPQPGERARALYALRETVLLDTTRVGLSLVEQRVRAEGTQANLLRRALRLQGPEAFATEREQLAQRRHARARRVGTLGWRDDRARNVFEIIEVFEFSDATQLDERSGQAVHETPPTLVALWFALPEDKPRRLPWSLPFPCEVSHSVTVKGVGMNAGAGRRRRWDEPEFIATQEDTRLSGAWTRTCRFTVLVPEVPVGRLAAYRRELEVYLLEGAWRIHLPPGRGRLHRGKGFGEFEDTAAGMATRRARLEMPAVSVSSVSDLKLESGSERRRRRREAGRLTSSNGAGWVRKVVLVVIVLVVLGVVRECVGVR